MNIRTFVFDFDSTLIKIESLDRLAEIALSEHPRRQEIMAQLEELTKRGMNGELAFDESLAARLRLFQADKAHLVQLTNELRQQFSDSIQKNRDWFVQNAECIYVVSGGFADYIEPVMADLGIAPEHIFANRFIFNNEKVAGADTSQLLSRVGGKVAQLAALDLPRPLAMIGDGFTDYEVFYHGQADHFWAYTENIARQAVLDKADHTINNFDKIISILKPQSVHQTVERFATAAIHG